MLREKEWLIKNAGGHLLRGVIQTRPKMGSLASTTGPAAHSISTGGGTAKNSWPVKSGRGVMASMNRLTLFGLFAVTAMLVFYALEDRSPWFILGFAGACALGSAYAWPFGVIEAVWAGVAVYRWRLRIVRRS